MSIILNTLINNVCGKKAEFLVLNVAVYTQNIVFTEEIAWTLHMMNLIREWWGIRWGLHGRLEDLDNADDVYLLSQSYQDMSKKICDLQTEVVTFDLKLNSNKTKELQISLKITSNTNVNKAVTDRVEQFTYLGNAVTLDGRTRIKKANGML
jgi:hypothetical protein